MNGSSNPVFKIGTINNIGHFFHETLFYAIDAWLNDKQTRWILHHHLTEWEQGITDMCAKYLGIECEYADLTGHRNACDLRINSTPNFAEILKLVRDSAKAEFPDVQYDPNYSVLYFRDDASRRRMQGYKGELNNRFNEVVYNMAAYSFADQVRMFMECGKFVSVEGATFTNIIFMDERARVLDISTTDNSWQTMFGTASCVGRFERMILGLSEFDWDIQYNGDIENRILTFLSG